MTLDSGSRLAHDEFVAARGPELVRTAYAIVGDAHVAGAATVRALAGLKDEWADVLDAGSPLRRGRAAVVREALRAVPAGGPTFQRTADPAAWDASVEDDPFDTAVLREYAALPDPIRALLALHTLEELDWPEAADACGIREPAARQQAAEGLTALDQARAESLAEGGRPEPGVEVGAHLAAVLRDAVDRAGLPNDLSIEVETAVGSVRSRRRRWVAGIAVAAVALTGGTVAVWNARSSDRAVRAAANSASATITTGKRATSGPVTWPARGSYATDPGVLKAVAAAGTPNWHIDSTYSNLGNPKVMWADVVGGRLFAAVAYPFFDTSGATLTGTAVNYFRSSNASPDGLVRDEAIPPSDAQSDLYAFVTGPGLGGGLVVIGPPTKKDVELSRVVTYERSGTVHRTDWRPLALVNGVAVASVAQTFSTVAAIRDGGQSTWVTTLDASADLSQVQLIDLLHRDSTLDLAVVDRRILAWTTSVAAGVTGLPQGRVTSRVLTSITDPKQDPVGYLDEGAGARVLVVLTTLPSGAVVRFVMEHPLGFGPHTWAVLVQPITPVGAATAAVQPTVIVHLRSADNAAGAPMEAFVIAPRSRWVTIRTQGRGTLTNAVIHGVAKFPISLEDVEGTVTAYDAARHVQGTWSWPYGGN